MAYSYSIDEEHFYGDFETLEEAKESGFANNTDDNVIWAELKCNSSI